MWTYRLNWFKCHLTLLVELLEIWYWHSLKVLSAIYFYIYCLCTYFQRQMCHFCVWIHISKNQQIFKLSSYCMMCRLSNTSQMHFLWTLHSSMARRVAFWSTLNIWKAPKPSSIHLGVLLKSTWTENWSSKSPLLDKPGFLSLHYLAKLDILLD